ncbi:hypothetical protein AKO1_005248 [Acrasis kona]|uniref:Uncharacterized protein n=1 Tax=Acrasis kona TaxID=1008807 RepID=A0AAW2YJV2_9EUKA
MNETEAFTPTPSPTPEPGPDLYLRNAKIIALFGLLVGSILAALVPVIVSRARFIRKRVSVKKITIFLDLAQGYGGGVLLGGGLLHLMAEAAEEIKEKLEKMEDTIAPWVVNFPWSPTLLCVALLTIFFFEIILTAIVKSFHKEKPKQEYINAVPPSSYGTTDVVINATHDHVHHHHDDHAHHHHHDEESEDVAHGHSHGDIGFHDLHNKSKATAVITGVILWLSLSIHSFFAGLGLGAEKKHSGLNGLLVAILSHKLVEAFALGSIINEGFRRGWIVVLFIIAFSLATPVGIAIGLGLSENSGLGFDLAKNCLLALASGAFIHVALFEVLFHQPDNVILKIIRFILYIIGFVQMAILSVWA